MSTTTPIRVLIADDHRVFADGLAALVGTQDDMAVAGIAGSVADAERETATTRPDVVLMDYELPDGTGLDALRRIKKSHPDTQVVMLTSFGDENILIAAIEAGCSGFVTKHRAGREVLEAVRAAAAGETLVAPDLLARLLPRLRTLEDPPQGKPVLSPREIQILELLAEGLPNQAIADRLVVSLNTVRNHVQNTLTKLGAHSRLEAVAAGVRLGLIRRAPTVGPR